MRYVQGSGDESAEIGLSIAQLHVAWTLEGITLGRPIRGVEDGGTWRSEPWSNSKRRSMRSAKTSRLADLMKAWELTCGLGVPADLVPCTRSDFEDEKDDVGTLARAAYHRGMRIYERRS